MLATRKFRLAIVASAAWVAGAYFVTPESYSFAWPNFIGALLGGWLAIWLAIFGAYWVIEAPASPIKIPVFPKWVGYALIAVMVFLIMGLPKALIN